ncbi:GNAT family N-acetyltransferase [Streptomyces sp. NPDC048639]|uniref:GNAT family N-acetyltransferase n=1 Tax=Streptomyces sp. NPDC048639 TaxID=3365581 RepID=UPI00372237C4
MTVIETGRLRLRPLTVADVEAFVALHADERVSAYVGAYSREQALERLAAVESQWAERGHGLCAIESRATGAFLGRSGLNHWPQFDEVEAGWTLRADAWGQGYATEAARAVVDWGFATLGLRSVTAMIRPGNTPSVRVAERLGFVPHREDSLFGNPVVVHVLHHDDRSSDARMES